MEVCSAEAMETFLRLLPFIPIVMAAAFLIFDINRTKKRHEEFKDKHDKIMKELEQSANESLLDIVGPSSTTMGKEEISGIKKLKKMLQNA